MPLKLFRFLVVVVVAAMASRLASRFTRTLVAPRFAQAPAPFGAFGARFFSIKVGDRMPNVHLDNGFGNPKNLNLGEFLKGKKVVLVGLPGAFTPT